jgi:hypothetical protein
LSPAAAIRGTAKQQSKSYRKKHGFRYMLILGLIEIQYFCFKRNSVTRVVMDGKKFKERMDLQFHSHELKRERTCGSSCTRLRRELTSGSSNTKLKEGVDLGSSCMRSKSES